MMTKKEPSTLGLFAIMTIAFVMMAFTGSTPAMGALAAQFPDAGQNISLLSNGYVFTLIVATPLCGWLTNSGKMKYKVATLIGALCMLIGGVGPVFVHGSFGVVLAWKLLFGVGIGFTMPLANALVLGLYEGQKQAKYLGWVTLLMNFGGIVYQMFGGIICDSFGAQAGGSGWFMHYAIYALAIVPLIFSFFIPEPEHHAPAAKADGSAAEKKSMGKGWIIASIFLFLINLLNYPVMMYMSNLFLVRGIGGATAATAAATALSLFTVAGMVAGFLYGTLFKALKHFIIVAGWAVMAIGALLIYIAGEVVMATLGCMLLGFGFSLLLPSLFTLIGLWTPPEKMTTATSITTTIQNVGALVVTPYLTMLAGMGFSPVDGSLYNIVIMVEVVVFALIAVLFIFYNPYPKDAAPQEAPAAKDEK